MFKTSPFLAITARVQSAIQLPAEFPSQVLDIAIVLTGGFEDLASRRQANLFLDLPWLGINLRVVDCDLNLHMPEVRPPKTLGDV